MPDPMKNLREYRRNLPPEKRDAFDEMMRKSPSAADAWAKVEGSHDSGWKRAGGALAQLGRAPIKVAEGALDIGSRATGGPGSRVGLALAKARNRVQGVGDMLDAADPHGGFAGAASEGVKIAGHAALAGLTGAGASAAVGKAGTMIPGLARGAAALRAGAGAGKAGWMAKAGREGVRQALRTAPMTVALSGGDNGGLASSALGVKNKWGRAALDVAEDATFGSLTSSLAARKAAKLAEQAKAGKVRAPKPKKLRPDPEKLAAAKTRVKAAQAEQKAGERTARRADRAPVGDTADMPLVTPPKAKAGPTRAEKSAANKAKFAAEKAAAEAKRQAEKAAGGGKKAGKQRPADKFFDYMDDVDEGDAPVLPLGASDKQIASWLKAAKKADPGFDDFGGDVKAYKAWRDEWNAAVKKNASAKPKAPKAEPQAAPKAEAPKATTPDTPEVRAAKERVDAAHERLSALKDDRLANGDNAARRKQIREATSEVKSAEHAHTNAVNNAVRKAEKAAGKAAPKAEAPAAEAPAEPRAPSTAGSWKDDPTDPRHGMSKAERTAYNQAEYAKGAPERQAAAAAKKLAKAGEAPAPKADAPAAPKAEPEAAEDFGEGFEHFTQFAETMHTVKNKDLRAVVRELRDDIAALPQSRGDKAARREQAATERLIAAIERQIAKKAPTRGAAASATRAATEERPMRPGDVIGDGEAKLSPRTQAAVDAEAEVDRLKAELDKLGTGQGDERVVLTDKLKRANAAAEGDLTARRIQQRVAANKAKGTNPLDGSDVPEPTKPNTANLNEAEKAELVRLKRVTKSLNGPKPDATLLARMSDEDLVSLRQHLLRERDTKVGEEVPSSAAWKAADKEWKLRKARRKLTKANEAAKVARERGEPQAPAEPMRPPLAPNGTVRKNGKVLPKKNRGSFNEGDGAQEASPVAKAVARGADEDEVTWRMRLHEQEAAKVSAAEAEVVRVRADRKATLAQTRAAQAALADARAAEKQAKLATQRAARGWGEPRKGQPVQHSSLAVAEDRAKLAASKTELERLRDEMAEAGRAADAKPKDRALTEAAIASAKAYRAALAIAKREGMQAGTGAVIGGTLAAGEDLSAQDGESGGDRTSKAERIGMGMMLGAGALVGGGSALRKWRGKGARNVTSAAKKVLSEEERILALPKKEQALARSRARAGLNPTGSVSGVRPQGPGYIDPNQPHPALGGKAPSELLNMNREGYRDLSPESQARMATVLIEQLAPVKRESMNAVRNAAAKMLADLPPDVLATMPQGKSRMGRAQTVAIATRALEMTKEIEDDIARLHTGNLGRMEKVALKIVIDRKNGEQVKLFRLLQTQGTETARDLNAFKAVAHVTSPNMFVAKMERLLGKSLEEHEAQQIRDLLAANDVAGAVEYVTTLNRATIARKVVTFRNTGLLAGIPGRVKDVASSTGHLATETAITPITTGVDRVFGRTIGKAMRRAGMEQAGPMRSITLPTGAQLGATAKGMAEGTKNFVSETLGMDAVRKAPAGQRLAAWTEEMRRTRLTQDQLNARDLPNIITFDNKGVDTYVKFVQRAQAGVDNIVKMGSAEAEKHNMARVLAMQDLADGTITEAELAAKTAGYIKTPTPEMQDAMDTFARSMTFQTRGLASRMARVLKQTLAREAADMHPALGEAVGAVVNMAVPFATTGANIGARVIDYTPLGLIRGVWMGWLLKNDIDKGARLTAGLIRARQRDAVDAVGRSMAGTAVMGTTAGMGLLGYDLYRAGVLSGQESKDPAKREADRAAGRLPNAINMFGRWVPLGQYSPIGNLLTVGATIGRAVDDGEMEAPESPVDMMRMATAGVKMTMIAGKSVLEQPLVTGLKGTLDTFSDPIGESSGYFGQMAGSFVPTFVNDIANATDEGRSRMVDRDDLMSNMAGNIARRLPGVRKLLPQEYDLLGGEVRARRGGALTAILPVGGMKDRAGNPDLPEAQALWAAGGGARLPRRGKDESLADFSERTRITGEEVRRAMRQRMGGRQVEWPADPQAREELQDWMRQTASIGRTRAQARLREAGLLVPRK